MLELRDYQQEAVHAVIQAAKEGTRRQVVVLPTGSGKTIVAAELSRLSAKGRTLFLVHRDELVEQSVEKLSLVWNRSEIGVVKAERNDVDAKAIVASVQTLSKPKRLDQLDASSFSLVVQDEAHHVTSRSYRMVLEGLGLLPETTPGRLLLGITATPRRSDGMPLSDVFEKITYQKNIRDLIDAGYLADVQAVQVKTKLDLSRVRITAGDFNEKDLALAVNTPERNRLVVDAYKQYGVGRKTVVFTANIQHARDLAAAFSKRGVRAQAVWGDMPKADRIKARHAFRDGEIRMLCNAQVLTEGWDEPSVEAIIMARPTKSQTFFMQCVGRGLRTFPGKSDCLILDVADNAHDLISIASIGGLDERQERDGSAKREPAEQPLAQGGPTDDLLAGAEVVIHPVDLLARSQFAWHREGRSKLRLEAGPKTDIYLRTVEPGADGDPRYEVELRGVGVKEQLGESLPLGYAQGVAEDWLRKHGREDYSSREADWRTEPATQEDLSELRRLGFPVKSDSSLTREQAQEMIRKAKLDRALKNPDAAWAQKPATDRQLVFLTKRDLPRWPGMTAWDASQVQNALFGRKWQALSEYGEYAKDHGGKAGRFQFGRKKKKKGDKAGEA